MGDASCSVVFSQDFDGVIGMFSGKELPPSLGTDTGMLKLQFTSDGSIEVSSIQSKEECSCWQQLSALHVACQQHND